LQPQQTTPTSEGRSPQLEQLDPLQPLLQRLGITVWDLLLLGDGSGNAVDRPCGWAGILIDNQTKGRRVNFGAMNAGSINLAETMPYLSLLNWFDGQYGKARLESQGFLNVHVVTDSQVVATWGNAAMANDMRVPRKHGAFWASLRYLRTLGYVCHFHWESRQRSRFNWAADLIAGLSRVAMCSAAQLTPADLTVAQNAARVISELDFEDPMTGPLDVYSLA